MKEILMAETTTHTHDRLRRPSGLRSLTLGDTTLTYVPDGVATLDARMLLPEAGEDFWSENADYLDEGGHLIASVGGLLVERDGRALLIDAGVGPIEVGPPLNTYGLISGGALLANLEALGRDAGDFDAVALTHLHSDHFGWAWHPGPAGDGTAFANAAFLIADVEWSQRHVAEAQGMGDMIAALAPRVRTVPLDAEIFPGVSIRHAPGHSAGHSAFVISAGGQKVVAFGDAFHTPIQVEHPRWRNMFDHDHDQAVALRQSLIAELAEPDTIGFAIHFPETPFGRVRVEDGRSVWESIVE
jgi:glyoxylase-like metal-dependent hydrolase (beta-lactamase superfamily II)